MNNKDNDKKLRRNEGQVDTLVMRGRINSRFELSHPDVGVITYERKLSDAVTIGKDYAKRNNLCNRDITIYDSMANNKSQRVFKLDELT